MKDSNSDLALKLVGFTVGTVLLLALLYHERVLVVCLLLSITVASAMAPLAEWAEKRRVPRMVTVLGIYAFVALIYVLMAVSFFPTARDQAIALYNHFPAYLAKVQDWYQSALSQAGAPSKALAIDAAAMQSVSVQVLQRTASLSADVLSAVLHAVLVLFVAAYFVVEANNLWPALLKWLPENKRERAATLIKPLESRMGGYVRGQLTVAMAVGFFLGTGFALIGLDYAVLLGILAAILNLVPYVGSFAACALAIIVALNQSPMVAVGVLVIFFIEQWAESTFFVPMLLGKHVGLHPLMVLFAMLIGASLMGIVGALVAVPLTSAIVYMLEQFYLNRELPPA